ncbi:MAG: phosphoglycolate phosphatase [Candidatus Binatota bacterium]|nr:phosphoglycolate phosphatase [Candidatus Binatota bacterium]
MRACFGLPPLRPEEVYRLVGRGARVLVERALGPERPELHDEGMRLFLEHYGEHCLDQTRPYPGVVAAMDVLASNGVVFSVVTNKPERLTRKILTGLGLDGRFVAVVGGDTFPERKPHPRGVEHARQAAGVARERSLMVGDSSVDVETARAAGIPCCGVLWGIDPEGLGAAGPEFLVGAAEELIPLIAG